MYELDSVKAEKLIEKSEVKEKELEKHFLFSREDPESIDTLTEFYSIVRKDDESSMLHFKQGGKNVEENIETQKVVSALKEQDFTPFMKLEIERYFLKIEGKEEVIEKVEDLGFFAEKEELGGRKAFYGDILLEKMNSDTESKEKVKKEAREIL